MRPSPSPPCSAASPRASRSRKGPARPAGRRISATLRNLALDLVNQDRAEHGLPKLASDDTLDEIAQNHASDQLARDYYGHVSPEGKDVQDRYIAAGGNKWRLVEENIATCTGCEVSRDEVKRLETGWMHSPGHRANILRQGIERFGYGIAGENGRVYAVQTFSGPGSSEDGQETAATRSEIGQAGLKAINEARREAGVEPLTLSDALSTGARGMMPEKDASSFAPGTMQDFTSALPADARAEYSRFSTAIGICGGCGTKPTTADIRDFVDQWLGNSRQKKTLTSSDFSRLGIAVAADGQGKKIGIAVFGQTR